MDIGDISAAVQKSLDQYEKLRGKDVHEMGVVFWDLVILTGRDEAQCKAYRKQIQDKQHWGHLPHGVTYLVLADPPGPKIGCGGCTFKVLHNLHQQYGDALFEKRILLINAGGYSQRLPSTSVLGKIFMALPIDKPHMYQLLDYKLACYLPFLQDMRPGVFHAASDTMEMFDLGLASPSVYSFDREGFTAIAHPNTLQVGQNHGVFVFDKKLQGEGDVDAPSAEIHSCVEVLQKPSIAMMHQRGAVRKDVRSGAELVYTDSCYFYDHTITKKFIDFYQKEAPFDCEIDSYGDFFQPLGSKATEEYVYNTSKVVHVVDSLIPTRKKIFAMLKGSPIHAIVLNASKFYHLGTSKEYLHHFCCNSVMAKEVSFTREEFCVFPCENSDGVPRKPLIESHHEGMHLHSIIPYSSTIASTSIVEYCHFAVPVQVGARCIVSNCTVSDDHCSAPLDVPAELFLHTVPVNKPHGYCTVLFSIHDNVKQVAKSTADIPHMTYLDQPLSLVQTRLGWSSVDSSSSSNENITLWETKLFPVYPSMSESFLGALGIIKAVQNDEKVSDDLPELPRFSMADIMSNKNLDDMLQYRHDLHTCIVALKDHQDPQ